MVTKSRYNFVVCTLKVAMKLIPSYVEPRYQFKIGLMSKNNLIKIIMDITEQFSRKFALLFLS